MFETLSPNSAMTLPRFGGTMPDGIVSENPPSSTRDLGRSAPASPQSKIAGRANPHEAGETRRSSPWQPATFDFSANGKGNRTAAWKRLTDAFDLGETSEPRALVTFHGTSFDTERRDASEKGGNVDEALRAFEKSAKRSAGLSLISTLVSSVVSGARRLSQGS